MSCCVPEYDFCLIRGNSWSLGVGFQDDPYGIAENPGLWSGEIGIRHSQSDGVANLLTLTSLVEADSETRPPNMPQISWIMTFSATTAQTQALPRKNLVAYCEIINSSAGLRRRLWQGSVHVGD